MNKKMAKHIVLPFFIITQITYCTVIDKYKVKKQGDTYYEI